MRQSISHYALQYLLHSIYNCFVGGFSLPVALGRAGVEKSFMMLKRVKLSELVVKQEMELNDAKLSYNVLPYKQFGVSDDLDAG